MNKKFKITGMMCEGCASSVQDIIKHIPTVQSVEVDLKSKTANVISEKEVSKEDIEAVFQANDSNYQVEEA